MFIKESEALTALLKHWRAGNLERYKKEILGFGGKYSDPSTVSLTGRDTDYHPNLTPVPYVGDLLRAKVFLLMLNPGYKQFYEVYEQAKCDFEKFPSRFDGNYGGYGQPDDVYGEYFGRYGDKALENLEHRRFRLRFWPLEDEASDTDFGKYWVRMLRPVYEKIGSWEPIIENFAMLNLIPYRSTHFKETKGVFECGSCQLIKTFVHEDLLKRENTLVIVARRPKIWAVEGEHTASTHVFQGVECRGIHLHGIADKIVEFLTRE